jgi:hypothetical protein
MPLAASRRVSTITVSKGNEGGTMAQFESLSSEELNTVAGGAFWDWFFGRQVSAFDRQYCSNESGWQREFCYGVMDHRHYYPGEPAGFGWE